MLLRLLLLLFACSPLAEGGKFLFYFPVASKSHKIAFMPLVEELSKRGHEITIITPHRTKKPNPGVTEIFIESNFDAFGERIADAKLLNNTEGSFPDVMREFSEVALETHGRALNHPEVLKILAGEAHFDVTVTDPFFLNEVGYFISHKIKSSLVVFYAGTSSLPWMNWAGGNVFNPSYMPSSLLPYSSNMNLKERIINTLVSLAFTLVGREVFMLPKVRQAWAQKFPNEDPPDLKEIENNAALSITVGNPFIADGLRPVLPNTILAGFMSCRPGQLPLPKNLQDWIEGAQHGVVYVSFGSVLKSSVMSNEKRDSFVSVLGSLKQRVIWKWEDKLPQQPPNILASSWLPQTAILSHPNVKLFVTHGGAGSVVETICHKKPVVGIPISSDQYSNLLDVKSKGFGYVINWEDVTEESLKKGINTVLEDEKYEEAVKELGDLVMDQPQHPLDRATWWMEYVLRHPGNKRMKSAVHDLWWHQYFLLDVILVIAVFTSLIGFAIFKLLIKCAGICKNAKTKTE